MDLSLNLQAHWSSANACWRAKEGKGAHRGGGNHAEHAAGVSDLIFKGEGGRAEGPDEAARRELGMQTFDQALFDLFELGEISLEDALRNADSVNDLRLQVKLNSQRARRRDLSEGTEHLTIM